MPGMSGPEAIPRLRRLVPEAGIVALTLLMFARPDRGLMAVIASESAGGIMIVLATPGYGGPPPLHVSRRTPPRPFTGHARSTSAPSVAGAAMLVAKGRLVFDRDVDLWLNLALKLPGVEPAPLSPRIAVRSARLGEGFLGDPADCVIVATALEYGWAIVSKDERIRSYPGVRVIW